MDQTTERIEASSQPGTRPADRHTQQTVPIHTLPFDNPHIYCAILLLPDPGARSITRVSLDSPTGGNGRGLPTASKEGSPGTRTYVQRSNAFLHPRCLRKSTPGETPWLARECCNCHATELSHLFVFVFVSVSQSQVSRRRPARSE